MAIELVPTIRVIKKKLNILGGQERERGGKAAIFTRYISRFLVSYRSDPTPEVR